jgi:hypothetical protein
MSLTCALPLPPPPKAMAMGMEVDFAEEEEEPRGGDGEQREGGWCQGAALLAVSVTVSRRRCLPLAGVKAYRVWMRRFWAVVDARWQVITHHRRRGALAGAVQVPEVLQLCRRRR